MTRFPRRPRAVIDACCLYPRYLRDVLLTTAAFNLFVPYRSRSILDEAARNLIENFPDDLHRRERVAHLLSRMEDAFPRASASDEIWQPHVERMTNHPKDRHVLAVAVGAGVPFIVTENLQHFPRSACRPWKIQAIHPDEFLTVLAHRHRLAISEAMESMGSRYSRPALTREELLNAIRAKAPSLARMLTDLHSAI